MKKFFPAGFVKDLRPGKGKKIRIKKRTIALFNIKNTIYAIQNRCPHQNADLADGYVKDKKVHCAVHHWAFDITTGAYSFNPKVSIETFDVKIEDGIIYIGIDMT